MAITGEGCDLFFDDCTETMSEGELSRMITGKDANGCPAIKVIVVEKALSNDYVEDTYWDGTNHICNLFYK